MKTGLKPPIKARKANFTFEVVCLGVIVKKDFTWSVLPLNIRSNWFSLQGLNPSDGRMRTKNKKLYRFLKANSTKAKRAELMKRCRVLFD